MGLLKVIMFILIFNPFIGLWSEEKEDQILVIANPIVSEAEQTSALHSVIYIDDTIKKNHQSVAQVLSAEPGLEVLSQGGVGKVSTLFIRGTNSEHTLVLIDGIEVNDPISPTRSFDFARLSLNDVQQIEVIKGPQSVVYGSDALGGVINIITKPGKGPIQRSIKLETGSYDYFKTTVGISSGEQKLKYNLGFSGLNLNGFSAANEKDGNTEKDGLRQFELSSKVNLNVSENVDGELVGKYIENKNEIDRGGGPGKDDPNALERVRQFYSKLKLSLYLLPQFETQFLSHLTFNFRRDRNDLDALSSEVKNDYFKGIQLKQSLINNLYFGSSNILSIGFEDERESGETNKLNQQKTKNQAAFVHSQLVGEHMFLNLGLRYDKNDTQKKGRVWSYQISPGVEYKPASFKLQASIGNGFKVPSLSQLYDSTYGNTELNIEKVLSWDIGWKQGLFNDHLQFQLNYFKNNFDNLISFDPVTYKSINIGESDINGGEFLINYAFNSKTKLSLNYTRLFDYHDRKNNQKLVRRPENSISASYESKISDQLTIHFNYKYIGHRDDYDATNFSKVRSDSHDYINVHMSYLLKKKMDTFFHINNLFNNKYEEINGYAAPALNFHTGIKLIY